MSTTASENVARKTPEEFAKNYPVIAKDGFYGPFSMGNISQHDGRILMNVCVRVPKSGDRNGVFSVPSNWYEGKALPFQAGDQINILVENGYIKKAFRAKAKTVSTIFAASINREVAEARDKVSAEKAVEEVVKEISQSVTAQTVSDQPF